MRDVLHRHRLEVKYILIGVVVIGGLIALESADALGGADEAVNDALTSTKGLGAIGIFVVALLANCVILVQVPYTLPVLAAALGGASFVEMLVLGIAAGVGAGVGESIKYTIAERVLRKKPDLARSGLYRWVTQKVEQRPRTVKWIVFVWAASLIPDDTVVIPLAMVRYGFRRIVAPLFLGKVVHNVTLALLFYAFTDWAARNIHGGVRVDLALGVIVAFVLLVLYQVEKVRSLEPTYEATVEAEIDREAAERG